METSLNHVRLAPTVLEVAVYTYTTIVSSFAAILKRMKEFTLSDGTTFTLPTEWEQAYARVFDNTYPTVVAERLNFLTGKYAEHKTSPSKFDGIGCGGPVSEDEGFEGHIHKGDDRYDCERFYLGGQEMRTLAESAHEVMYQNLRIALMQQALDSYAQEHGTKPIRVLTPEQLLEEIAAEGVEAGPNAVEAGPDRDKHLPN